MKKRLVSLCMALALCLTLLPTAAWAADADTVLPPTAAKTYYLWQIAGNTSIFKEDSEPTESDLENGGGDTLTASDGYYKLDGDGYSYVLKSDITIDKPLQITDTTTLDLNGHVLKMTGNDSVIKVKSGGNLTLKDSNKDNLSHKFTVNDDGLWVLDETDGTETVTGGVITGSNVTGRSFGGGVLVDGGTFTMNGGNIVGCTANYSQSGNDSYGGGVCVESGSFDMSGGSIVGCTVSSSSSAYGGGVLVSNGYFAMSGGTISSCKVSGSYSACGGGVLVSNGYFAMSGGIIEGCETRGSELYALGDGVFLFPGCTLYANGGEIDDEVYVYNATITRSDGATDYTTFNGTVTGYGTIVPATCPYTVTFDYNYDGSTPTTQGVLKGQKATAPDPAPTRDGYTFGGWYTAQEGGTEFDFDSTVTESTTLYAVWTKNSSSSSRPTYPITVADTDNGVVTASAKSAKSGRTVTVTVTPDQGYALETLTVLDKNGKEVALTDKGDGTYTFTMPSGQVTVAATFQEDNTMLNHFVDVTASDYYYDAVLWAAENGITGGVDETHFGPALSCTRAQLVTFLWRAAGSPVVSDPVAFTDVDGNAYYAEAVRWAASLDIVGGYGNGLFGTADTVTREQVATILYRYAQAMGLDVSVGEDTNLLSFTDASAVSDYAVAAMQWAVGAGIVQGDNGKLLPQGACTRAQIVTMLYRLLG